MNQTVIKLKTAGKRMDCSYSTVLRLVHSGELPAFRVRTTWRTTEEACAGYVNQQFVKQCKEICAKKLRK